VIKQKKIQVSSQPRKLHTLAISIEVWLIVCKGDPLFVKVAVSYAYRFL